MTGVRLALCACGTRVCYSCNAPVPGDLYLRHRCTSCRTQLIAEFDHPDIGRVRQPKPAARFDRTPAAIRGPAPRIGEHSAIILAELGLETAEIERLAAEKIVRLVKA